MKVSIIIPVYNVEKYLKKCLDSAINQTWRDIEVIVIDDASPDHCRDMIKQYEQTYPKIMKAIYLEHNLCQGGARNKGLEIATGDYVLYLDSDDYIDETMCEKLITEAQKTDADIVYCDVYREFEEEGRKAWSSYQFAEEMGDMTEEKIRLQLLNYGYVWARLIRTELLKKNHILFPEHKKYEDFAFMPLVVMYAHRTAYVKKPLYYYNIREQSVMTTRNAQHHTDMVDAGELVYEELKKRGFGRYADMMRAIAYYKAVKLIVDKNDEPDEEYIYQLAQVMKEEYHPPVKELYLAHDPIEIQIMESAQRSRQELTEKIKEHAFAEANVDYTHFYEIFQEEISGIFHQYAGKRIAIWGYGKKGKCLLNVIHSCGMRPEYILDKNKALQGTVLETGETIKGYEDVCNSVDVVIVVNRNYFSAIEAEIRERNAAIEICNLDARFMNYA